MDFISEPHRCPKCHALVVDRRSSTCTTCRVALPADWIMTKDQTAKVAALDQAARAQYKSVMNNLEGLGVGGSVDNPPL
jgi:ribosomal protein L37AE/L43A